MALEKQPDEMLVCNLECVIMPNGEIISAGKSIGWFRELGQYLTPLRHADGSPYKEEK